MNRNSTECAAEYATKCGAGNMAKNSAAYAVKSVAKYVDPMIGTVGDEKATSMHGGGKTHPGACFPGGMVQLSPDTVTGGDNGTGYNYCQDTIEGFSFNHMSGIGWYGDLGNLQVMPVTGKTDLRSGSNREIPFAKGTEGWKSKFSHERECAKAGYYSVWLDRYGILTEATVSEHTGMLRMTYPVTENPGLLFNFSRRIAGHADYEKVRILSNSRIEGQIHCTPAGGGFGRGGGKISYDLFFVCELSVPAKEMRFFSNEEYLQENLSYFENEDVGLRVSFERELKEPVVLKCGISYTDLEGARDNLNTECRDFDFDRMERNAFAEWEKALGTVKADSNDETILKIFYSCLYHTLLDPRTAVDANGYFRIGEEKLKAEKYKQRTMFSGWDVYRSEFPLLTIIRPEMVDDEVNSLLRIAQIRNTSFPRWELMGIDSHCMVGDPGLLVIADAYLKGIAGFDVEKAYQIAKASGRREASLNGREFHSFYPEVKQYVRDAYVPNSLSATLEFLLADYAMAMFAKRMGKTQDAEYYLQRAKRYTENYNPEIGFMAPRDENGRFIPVEDEYSETGCVESNILQQSWFVPYDVEGLSRLFGKERMLEILERFFEKADLTALWNINYNHSNEPCHNITHYFNLLGEPDRTQYWTRRVQREAYRTGAFGFCGNEDVGQLSAWYVLSALGLAQICPGCAVYLVNTPLVKRAEIKLDKKYHSCLVSDRFCIECDQDPISYGYICRIELNGTHLNRLYLTYTEITAGGILKFFLSQEPCREQGCAVPAGEENGRRR